MLRTNLATRPFYNERAVYMVLGVVAVVGLVVLSFAVNRIVDLSRQSTELTTDAEQAEFDAVEVLIQTEQRSISPQVLDEVAAAAREANLLIGQRVFSWTDFFNRIETTLPPDVMLTEVRPNIEPGTIRVTMGVLGRRLDVIDDFVDALEESSAFTGVLRRTWELTDDEMYTAVVQGQYLQTIPTGPAGEDDNTAEASSAGEGARDSGSEADAESGQEAASAEEDALPDGDDEPSPEAREPDVEDTPAGGAGPEVEPAPTPAGCGGDLS